MEGRSVSQGTTGEIAPLHEAFFSTKHVDGLTHNVYRYPARFSPEFVRAALEEFSSSGDRVLDPFMGGGTTAVESLALGRRFVGFDVNPLSLLLARAKTTPLSRLDREALRLWLQRSLPLRPLADDSDPRLRNAPAPIVSVLGGAVEGVNTLDSARQQDAARAVLLGAAQRAIDGRNLPASSDVVPRLAAEHLERLFAGLQAFRIEVANQGIGPGDIARRRVLRLAEAQLAARSRGLNRLVSGCRLVVTSPPYPGVHVLYHRWQVHGRTETPMPYWIADLQDGMGPKHYTMGGRSSVGQESYFDEMRETWAAVRRLLAPDALVIQLVAFSKPALQVQRYRAMMTEAGYEPVPELEPVGQRDVPNRRWYYRIEPDRLQAKESLMVHRISR